MFPSFKMEIIPPLVWLRKQMTFRLGNEEYQEYQTKTGARLLSFLVDTEIASKK